MPCLGMILVVVMDGFGCEIWRGDAVRYDRPTEQSLATEGLEAGRELQPAAL